MRILDFRFWIDSTDKSRGGYHQEILGQNRTPDLGALWLGHTNVIRIGVHRFLHFFMLEKSVGESLSPVVGNEGNWVFWDWLRSAIPRTFGYKFILPVGDFNFTLYQRLVFPIYGKSNGF